MTQWGHYTDTGSAVSNIDITTNSATIANGEWTSVAASTAVVGTGDVWYYPQQYGEYTTLAGVHINLDVVKDDKEERGIHPRLYFKFVKTKLTKLQQREMHERLEKLQKLVVQAKNLGQKALYEELSRKIAITVKEQEINVCGIEYCIHGEIINKYRNKVKGPAIGFCKLKSYSRPIPANVKKRLEACQKLKLFDEYWVLYLEYKEKIDVDGKKKKESTKKKTNKEKIKEKDPILFGVQNYMPDKYYFIIDWIDEYCDLTLDKFVETIKKDTPEYELDTIEDITPKMLKRLVKESKERYDRLGKTNQDNYKDLMEEEDELDKKRSLWSRTKREASKIKNKFKK